MNMTVRIQLSIMMFLQFFVWGSWFVTMGTYLGQGLHFEGSAIGGAYSTTAWAAIVSPFFVGMIADRFFATEKIMAVLHLLGGIFLFAASTVTSPALFFWVLLLHTLCYMPTLALVNSIAFDNMVSPEKEFPSIRVIGTIGWIVAGIVIGTGVRTVLGYSIEPTAIPFQIGAACSILLGLYCFTLPHTPPKSAGKQVSVRDVLGLDALTLLKDKNFAIFMASSLFICIPLSFYYQSGNLFLNELGVADAAFKQSFGQMSEIFFMLVMPLFFVRLGVKYMLIVGMLAWVARYFLFAYGDAGSGMWMLWIGILLHGVCYDFFFVTGQIYVDKKAPLAIRASAQGFIAFITLGVGMVIGNFINGRVTSAYTLAQPVQALAHDWRAIWLVPAIMAGVVAILFAVLFRDRTAADAEELKEEPVVLV